MRKLTDQELLAGFWANVSKCPGKNGCWLWIGAISGKRYGQANLRLCGEWKAHRASWVLHTGKKIPEGINVCHDCPGGDNPLCVRPSHLFLGSQLDNVRDSVRKGRRPRGEQMPQAKLTEIKVRQIREMWATGQYKSYAALSAVLEIPHTNIGYIVRRDTWKHVA